MIHNNLNNIIKINQTMNTTEFLNPLNRIKFIIFGGNINKVKKENYDDDQLES